MAETKKLNDSQAMTIRTALVALLPVIAEMQGKTLTPAMATLDNWTGENNAKADFVGILAEMGRALYTYDDSRKGSKLATQRFEVRSLVDKRIKEAVDAWRVVTAETANLSPSVRSLLGEKLSPPSKLEITYSDLEACGFEKDSSGKVSEKDVFEVIHSLVKEYKSEKTDRFDFSRGPRGEEARKLIVGGTPFTKVINAPANVEEQAAE